MAAPDAGPGHAAPQRAPQADGASHTLHWQLPAIDGWQDAPGRTFPLITAADVQPIAGDLDYWDAWPLLTREGALYASPSGVEYWFALAARRFDDPDDRHNHARIQLLERKAGVFRALGHALPAGFGDGSREWSGSAVIDPATLAITLYFTAAGRRGEASVTFEQRIFRARCKLADDQPLCWQPAEELFAADGETYAIANQPGPVDNRIMGFRDPAIFRDPADGREWISFTATSGTRMEPFGGLIGLAAIDGAGLARLLPPLIDASGFNHELELPHIRSFDGRYYLFWSTQSHMFAPGHMGPTGLYGAVADCLAGPWRLLNGNGLVAATPPAEPLQSYGWIVLPDRSVTSFINHWGLAGRAVADLPLRRAQFGGTFAPFVQLQIDGDDARLV